MNFFDKHYYTGQLTDAEFYDRALRYSRHITAISRNVKPNVAKLFEYSFHDALICNVHRIAPEHSFELVAVLGDIQKGYRNIRLNFQGVKIASPSYIVLLEATQAYGNELLEVEYNLIENDTVILTAAYCAECTRIA